MDGLFFALHQNIMDPQRIPYAIAAILLVLVAGAITGPLFGNAQPALWIVVNRLFGGFGDRLNKAGRPRNDLVFRGFLVTMLVLFLALALGKSFEFLSVTYPFYSITEIALLSLVLAGGALWFALLRLYFALEKSGKLVEGAYYAVARTHRANLNASDDFGITRLGMNLVARVFDKGLVAPVFWYLMGGLPLAVAYSALAALCWRFGKEGTSKGFANTALTLEKLMGIVPSALAAAILTAAGMFSPTARLDRAMEAWGGIKGRASYAQGGLPLSVLAWTLNLSLGGAYQDINGGAVKGKWVGPEKASARNDHKHLRRALIISLVAHALFIVILACAYLWGTKLAPPAI